MSNEQDKKHPKTLPEETSVASRRKFLAGGLAVAGLAACAGKDGINGLGGANGASGAAGANGTNGTNGASGPAGATGAIGSSTIPNWDKTVDVLVIGYGGAGAVAAITAKDLGSDVLIVEKAPIQGGGNTRMCGGVVVWPNDAVKGAAHLKALSWGATPDDVCAVWGTECNLNRAYFDTLGIKYTVAANTAEFPLLPGGDSINTLSVTGAGSALFAQLATHVTNRGIPVMFNSRATRLVQNPDTKEVLGVVVTENGAVATQTAIRARKAVVLCAGGFEFNDAMKNYYLRASPVKFYGWQYNTGDGIDLARQVGAGLWHMSVWSGRCVPWFADSGMPSAYSFSGPSGGSHYIYVDKYGARYGNEKTPSFGHNWWLKLTDFDIEEPGYTRIPTWMIFDETNRMGGSAASSSTTSGVSSLPPELGGVPAWSKDNSVEIAKGWILKGNSIAELATAIAAHDIGICAPAGSGKTTEQINSATLVAEVAKWNAFCAAGADTDHGRPNITTANSGIVTGPFYAMKLHPGGPNTQGGPIRNAKAQVCDYAGNPIPRLYSNGECGSVYGMLYPAGGGDITELFAFGRVAGRNAHAEIAAAT